MKTILVTNKLVDIPAEHTNKIVFIVITPFLISEFIILIFSHDVNTYPKVFLAQYKKGYSKGYKFNL